MASLSDDQYLNPVYGRSFPDPFILKFRGEYIGYCTGLASDGKVFPMLRSSDLVTWHELGGAMHRLDTDDPFYWGPEATYYNGKFYLYYSVGNETLMHLRVATSDTPVGPFVDSGVKLTSEEFAIDAHVFRDDDGRWFMFYATDFLTHSHIGTGTVIDGMIDPFTLAGEARPVTRARYDWQVYDPERREKGGVRWHTVEGPTVLKRKGRYFEMFSGGNWQNITYGVSYAVTDDIDSHDEWHQHSDGITNLPILRTIPDRVIGPGHNSVIRGPNNRELYCVYHRWAGDERVLAVDRMDFAGDESLTISGPTFTPQPRPYPPHALHSFAGTISDAWRIIKGDWRPEDTGLRSVSPTENEILYETRSESFLAELYVRSSSNALASFGIKLQLAEDDSLVFLIDPGARQAVVISDLSGQQTFALPENFDPATFHHIRVEADHRWTSIAIDDVDLIFNTELDSAVSGIVLLATGNDAFFSAFAVTYGFEERFEQSDIFHRGWTINGSTEAITIERQLMLIDCEGGRSAALSKPVDDDDHELVINLCPVRFGYKGCIAFGALRSIKSSISGNMELEIGDFHVALPHDSLGSFKQFRVVQRAQTLDLYLNGQHLTSTAATDHSSKIEIEVIDAVAAVDMFRYTPLDPLLYQGSTFAIDGIEK